MLKNRNTLSLLHIKVHFNVFTCTKQSFPSRRTRPDAKEGRRWEKEGQANSSLKTDISSSK